MRYRWTIIVGSAALGCLFDPGQTRGLPCNTNDDCGSEFSCIDHICGGPAGSSGTTHSATSMGTTGGSAEARGADEDEGEPDDLVPPEVPSLPCMEGLSSCVGDDVVKYCSGGKQSTIGCQGICGESRASLGCHYSSMTSRDTCFCEGEPPACEVENELSCAPGIALGVCQQGLLVAMDCDEICVDAGYAGADDCGAGQTGQDVCLCGNRCREGAQRCDGTAQISGCFGGTWHASLCLQICLDNGYLSSLGCRYDPVWADSGCHCI